MINMQGKRLLKLKYGLDFGYTNDPTALVFVMVDEENREIYICDEFYQRKQSARDISKMLRYKGIDKEEIVCDHEPRTIDDLKYLGIVGARPAKKGKDSINAGINKLQSYRMLVHPRCENFIVELNNYVWQKDKITNRLLNKPIDEFNHLLDALRYATEDIYAPSYRF